MTPHEWKAEWRRLDHFRAGGDGDRGALEAEWFAQLRHYHVDAVHDGITKLIGHAKDTFLPGLGLLKDFIQQRFDKYERTSGKCQTCHGSSWVDAPLFRSNGLIYANALQRCPDCGIPAPTGDVNQRRERVSELHTHEYLAGRFGREQMPEGLQAKHPDRPGNPEMKAAMARLHVTLFGVPPMDRKQEEPA